MALLILALLAACSGSPEPTSKAPGQTIVVAAMMDFGTLVPVVANSALDMDLIDNLQRPLLERSFDCGVTFSPGLASSWEFSEDGQQLTLHLRSDVTWSDGTPFTAADVVMTHSLIADPIVASPRLDYVARMDGPPTAIDAHTVRFAFTEAYDQTAMLAHATWIAPVPAHAFGDADRSTLRGHALGRDPLVTGPWRLDTWRQGQALVIQRDVSKQAGARPIERVVFRPIPEYTTRLIELENGSVDVLDQIDVNDVPRLKQAGAHTLHRRGWRSLEYLVWNRLDPADYKAKKAALQPGQVLDWDTVAPHPVLGDLAVRQALSTALDIDSLMKDLLGTTTGDLYGRRAVSTISPELCGSHAQDIVPWPYDPDRARTELAAAGWIDADGDGIRDKNGVPMHITLGTNAGNPRRAMAGVRMQAMLAEVGVKVELQRTEAHTFWAGLRAKQFDAAISGRSAMLWPQLTPIWHSGDQYLWNYASYSDAETDRLMEAALRETDPTKASVLWKQAQARIHAEQPWVFLWWRDDVVAVNKRIDDADVGPLSAWAHIDRWAADEP